VNTSRRALVGRVARDVLRFGLGAFILIHEEWTGHFNDLLAFAGIALCVGWSTVSALVALRTGKNVTVSITDSSPPSVSSSSPSPPSGHS